MNAQHFITHTFFKKATNVLTGMAFVLVTALSVYFTDALLTTPEYANTASAWQCEYVQANPVTINEGESSTLSWKFEDDEGIYVTIDKLPGQGWEGVSGSTSVSPKETTTYRVIAHKVGSEATFECSATVTVKPVESCDAVDASITGTSFTFSGPPALRSYKVDFCDSTNTGWVDGTWSERETIELGKRIKAVFVEAGTCKKTVYANCDTARVPECPFTPSANVTVINFNGGKTKDASTALFSNSDSRYEITKPLSFQEGVYTVRTFSWDGYSGREDVTQPHEQWNVEVRNASGAVLGLVGPTTDLADRVYQDMKTDTFSKAITLSQPGSLLALKHAAYPDNTSPNSVIPVCVAFERQVPGDEPLCTMSISPSKVNKGESATLTWSGTNVTSASIDQGIGSVSTAGSRSVSVREKTLYTGTFKDDSGKTVTCTASISIKSGGGKCINCDDDDDDDEEDDDDPEPNIVLSKTVTKIGSYVTLDQVPYTGFKAGPMLTTFFWLAVLLLSAGIAYVTTRVRPLVRLRTALSSHVSGRHPVNHIVDEVAYPHTTEQAGSYTYAATDAYVRMDSVSTIEEMAHKENILLSPEALRHIQIEIKRVDMNEEEYLARLFTKAQERYTKEDGWILLSKERAEVLTESVGVQGTISTFQDIQTSTISSISSERPHRVEQKLLSNDEVVRPVDALKERTAQPQPITVPQQNHTDTDRTHTQVKQSTERSVDDLVALFIDNLIHVERKKTFDILRTVHAKGVDLATFMSIVVRQLDAVYRHRIEGNHNPNRELAQKTAVWSNNDFEMILGILVECIDYSYTSNSIGTKIALTKAFDHFARTQNGK